MQLNLDLVLKAPEYRDLVERLRTMLQLANKQASPMTLVALRIENTTTTGTPLPVEVQTRLLNRERKIVATSVRTERDTARSQNRVTDEILMVGGVLFVALFNADFRTYLVPIGRVVSRFREEAANAANSMGLNYRCRLFVASAAWVPPSEPIAPETLVGKVLEAAVMVTAAPAPDAIRRLGLQLSPLDEVFLYEYPWDTIRTVARKDDTPKDEAHEARSARPKSFKRQATDELAKPGAPKSDPAKKRSIWPFGK